MFGLRAARSLVFSRTMTQLTPVITKNAPPAAASYSHAMKANNFIYVSGQIPYTPDNKPVEGSIADKAEQVIQNVKSILVESNSDMDKIVKVNVFLANMDYFAEFNKVYAKYFSVHKPARSCVAVNALPLGVDLEMEVVAVEKD
ncbi:Protein HMF1 [Nakaseomyces bracarensis]|uniref:Protein HMF1 n=1 Tax=Nakaseomyces bracarensis TaxID=273131 RepID=A0ABR4NRQ9_9SACH